MVIDSCIFHRLCVRELKGRGTKIAMFPFSSGSGCEGGVEESSVLVGLRRRKLGIEKTPKLAPERIDHFQIQASRERLYKYSIQYALSQEVESTRASVLDLSMGRQ